MFPGRHGLFFALALAAALGQVPAHVAAGEFWSQLGRPGSLTPTPPQRPHPAVARIIVPQRDGTSYGTGTLVAVGEKYGLVITNWHVIQDPAGPIVVRFADGFQSSATVLRIDREWDLAALGIWKPPVAPIPIAQSPPWIGETLTIAGYGSGAYRTAAGQCTQYVAPSNRHPYEMLEVSVSARNGDSGGPILNQKGELAGVLFGEGGGHTAGSYCGRVSEFVRPIAPVVTGHLPPDSASSLASAGPKPGMMPTPPGTGPPPLAGLAGVASPPTQRESAPPAFSRMPSFPASPSARSPAAVVTVRPPQPVAAMARAAPAPLPALAPASAAPPASSLTLDEILGVSPLEKSKSILAIIGTLTVAVFVRRAFRADAKK
jgi:serine protease Do